MTERIQRNGPGRRVSDCDGNEVCGSHSGTVTGIKGLYALLTILIGLIGGQMFVQIPSLKLDILNEVKGLTARIVELEKKDIEFSSRLNELTGRLDALEPKQNRKEHN